MHYHIILTKECNLNCSYCGGGSDTEPREIQYSISDLIKFLSLDKNPVIEFYGGEPLLRIQTIKRIMDAIPVRFVIQTNGLFLNRMEPDYLKRFHSILVSIDGKEEVTDKNRGFGVYERIMRNIKITREKGFPGDLVARMTVPQDMDIYSNMIHLAELKNPGFDHVHWQLGFEMFWESGIPGDSGLSEWINAYNDGVSSLVKWWLLKMESTRHVVGIVPFTGIVGSLLDGAPARLRCGSGIDFFTITPGGKISACPVSIDFDFSIIGSIYADDPASLCNKVVVAEPCISCEIFQICGGRCLFVNRAQHMLRKNGYEHICSTVRHLVRELQIVLPRIREMIESGIVRRSEFSYPEFNNGCEIIP